MYLTKFHQLRSGLGSSAPHRPAPHRSAIAHSNAAPRSAPRCPAAQLSSAPQRSASSAERSAVFCRALPCCVLCCTFLPVCTPEYMPMIFEVSYHVPVLIVLHQVCTCDVVIGSQTMHPQLSSARLYIAQQRSAVQCRALPFALRCWSCGAVRSFEHAAAVTSSCCSTRYDTDTRFMYVFVYSSFCFLQMIVLSRSPCPPPPRKHRTYCRSERDINKHIAQRRAMSSAQAPLGIIINSLFASNNHGPLLPAPYIYMFQLLNSCILPCASVAGGVSSLAKQSPMLSLEPHSRVPPGIGRSTRYQVPLVRVCARSFLLFRRWFCSPSRSSSRYFLRKLHPSYCRSERNITNTQHSTDRALGIIKSLVALNHGPLLSAPFTFIS